MVHECVGEEAVNSAVLVIYPNILILLNKKWEFPHVVKNNISTNVGIRLALWVCVCVRVRVRARI